MLRVEAAKPADISALISLLYEMHSEVSFKVGAPDRKKMVDALAACDLWTLRDHTDEIGGLLALRSGTLWYSSAPFLADLVFYIRPPWRTYKGAALLLRKAKEQSKIKGLPLILAANSGDDIARKVLLYKRLGFKQVGASFTLQDP